MFIFTSEQRLINNRGKNCCRNQRALLFCGR